MEPTPVPVFTVKLYRSMEPTAACSMLVAPRLEIERKAGLVILHVLDEAGKAKEDHQVGEGAAYAWAVVENPSGRTTEVIRPKSTRLTLRG